MENPRQRPKAFLLGALSAAIVGTVVGVFVLKPSKPVPRGYDDPVRKGPEDRAFEQAKNLIREGKWVEAKARLLELQARAPGYPGLVDYLAHVEKEIPNQEHLTAAKEALAAKTLAVAKAQLDEVSVDSMMFERVTPLWRELRDTADARVREAQALLDAGQREQASAILADVVAAFPEDQLARASLERAHPSYVETIGMAAEERILQAFAQRGISSAMALAEACAPKFSECRSSLKDLKEFRRLLKMKVLDSKQLSRLISLDHQFTRSSVLTKTVEEVSVRQAKIFYKDAVAARAAGAWQRAFEFARQTLQADPSHRGAADIIVELRSKAKESYLKAYALKDTDPEKALALFRDVMARTIPADEFHQKAEAWVDKLEVEIRTHR